MEKVYSEYGFVPSAKVIADKTEFSRYNRALNDAVGKVIEKQHEVKNLLESLRAECESLDNRIYRAVDNQQTIYEQQREDFGDKIRALEFDLQVESIKEKDEFKSQIDSFLAAQNDLQEQHRLYEENHEEVKKIVETLKDTCISLSNGVKTCQDNLGNFSDFVRSKFEEKSNGDKIRDEKIKNCESKRTDTQESSKELEEIQARITSLVQMVNSVESETKNYLNAKKESQEASATASQSPGVFYSFPSTHDICNEIQQRNRKEQNLVVFGLTESITDTETAQQLVSDIGSLSRISSSFRVGKVVEGKFRPLIIRFTSKHDRDDVYDRLKNLKGQSRWNSVSVTLDLTKMQCTEEKQIYNLLAKKAQDKNEVIDVSEGFWKVIGGRGRKRIVFSKK